MARSVMVGAPCEGFGSEAAGGDVAVRGGGADGQGGVGALGVLEGVVDTAVGCARVQGRGGGRAEVDVTLVRGQYDRAGDRLGDGDVAAPRADLTGSGEAADGDIPVGDGQAETGHVVDLYRAVGALEDDVAEASDSPEPRGGRVGLDAGADRQLDGDLDGSGGPEVLVPGGRGGDPQDAVAVVDLDLLGGLGVPAPVGIDGPDLDGGVGAVCGDDLDAPGGEVDDGGDGGGGVELLHQMLLRWLLFPMDEKLRCIHKFSNILVANYRYRRR